MEMSRRQIRSLCIALAFSPVRINSGSLYDVHEGIRKRDFNAKKFDALLIRFALGL